MAQLINSASTVPFDDNTPTVTFYRESFLPAGPDDPVAFDDEVVTEIVASVRTNGDRTATVVPGTPVVVGVISPSGWLTYGPESYVTPPWPSFPLTNPAVKLDEPVEAGSGSVESWGVLG